MALLHQLLTLVQLVGFAALLGGCLVQFRSVAPEVNRTMLIGAWTQLIAGLALVGVQAAGADPANPVNYAKFGVQFGLAAIVLLLAAKNRRFESIPKGLWALLTGLTFANACLAVLWT